MPLLLAILFHLIFFILLWISIFFNKKDDLPLDNHVFELASISNQEVDVPQRVKQATVAAPLIPQPPPVTKPPTPPSPTPPVLPAATPKAPIVKKQKKEKPSPLPPAKPVTSKKKASPPVVKKAPQKDIKMTKEDFDRLNPKKYIKPSVTIPTASKAPEYIPVETEDLKKDLAKWVKEKPIPKKNTLTRNENIKVLALENYKRGIKPKIERAWQKPSSLSVSRPTAVVQFDLLPSGKIINLRVIQSSGNATFDNSVKKAFRNVNSLGKVPYGSSLKQLRLTFEMR